MHGSLFRDIYSLANDQLKFNNAAKACLVKLNIKIILFHQIFMNILCIHTYITKSTI